MTQVQTPLNRLAVASGETLAWGVRTYVIGIISLTPDSFSGDGLGGDVDGAVDLALRFQEEGRTSSISAQSRPVPDTSRSP